ncbi:MAG: DUF3516 domain-containing protein [Actinomycetaceae bacterium]|nr:DUF3516 domain-containing protein [Actinomycetaceae bacterium]
MSAPLNELLDELEDNQQLDDADALYSAFTNWAQSTGRPLYPHQDEAFLELLSDNHVIAATPTGSGKSMIALAAHTLSLARRGRSYYTAPLKALVSEKFFDLVAVFGAENVGMVTGDGAINADAPIICCTAEILALQSLRQGADLDVDMVVMDEFHFYGEPDRGWAWQVPLLELTQCQFLLMSATLGDVSFFVEDLKKRTKREAAVIQSAKRPIPLEMSYTLTPLDQALRELIELGKFPVYVVHFTQRQATQTAQTLAATALITKAHRERLKAATKGFKFSTGFGQTLRKLIHAGVGIHHAGMLPRYRRLVERLTQSGLLAVICGTDTLGVGINVPITTVLFTSLAKFDGTRQRVLSAREFHQIAGRAGRAGFDEVGWVVVQAPLHVIENNHARLKAGDNPKKLKKLTRKHLPEGQIGWSESTYERLVNASPEPLQSQFRLTHSMVLNALQSPRPATEHLLYLARENHDQPTASNPHLRQLGHIYTSLENSGVVRTLSPQQAKEDGCDRLQLVADLPEDFALNQPLSPFALAAVELLSPTSPTFALDVISVVESVLDDPTALLLAQRRFERGQAVEQMKAAGIEYDERMAILDTISWPQPLDELLQDAFRVYAQTNPWVLGYEVSPKSVVRQMVEEAMTFSDLISRYDVARSEGVVLRYLTDAYRALRQTLPESVRTEEVESIITWLGELIAAVDSSLLDEWDDLARGERRQEDDAAAEDEEAAQLAFGARPDGSVPITANPHRFAQAVRNMIFTRVDRFALDDVAALVDFNDSDGVSAWDRQRWEETLDAYWDEYDWLGATANARSASRFAFTPHPQLADLLDAGVSEAVANAHAARIEAAEVTMVNYRMEDPYADEDWHMVWLIDEPASAEADAVVGWLLEVGVHE